MAKIKVALRRAVARNSPPDCCIKWVRVRCPAITKRTAPQRGAVLFVCGARDSNPPKCNMPVACCCHQFKNWGATRPPPGAEEGRGREWPRSVCNAGVCVKAHTGHRNRGLHLFLSNGQKCKSSPVVVFQCASLSINRPPLVIVPVRIYRFRQTAR